MRENYLWNDELTEEDDLASVYFKNSVAFLAGMKYTDDKVSYVDTAYSEPLSDYGFELATTQISDTAYMALLTYIEPASVAAKAGLLRGEWIMEVDGGLITSARLALLADGEAHELMIGHYTTYIIEEDGEEVEQGVVVFDRNVSLPAASSYAANDLPVVSVVDGLVGYMLYNDIAEANNDLVASASKSLSASGITNLVLDLRYAFSGDVSGLQYLASIVAPSNALGNKLATVQYAESRHADTSLPFLTASELDNGVNLNLSKLYVLTSSTTAGPAEMLINCLDAVMDVVVIGQKTQGIGVACESFYDPVSDQLLHLAACHVADANGEADYVGTGITPDVVADPFSPIEGILPFGSPSENLLSKALTLINE